MDETVQLLGAAQKGPFILGTTVGASPLTSEGQVKDFEAASSNDLGEFSVEDFPVGPVALGLAGAAPPASKPTAPRKFPDSRVFPSSVFCFALPTDFLPPTLPSL